ncbi:MAG: hypothetical protein VKJ64_01285 [Leptolyngbyaceae bacterium]|nr:hypothetical protein [Leptolyngbyaceae bacterium]
MAQSIDNYESGTTGSQQPHYPILGCVSSWGILPQRLLRLPSIH